MKEKRGGILNSTLSSRGTNIMEGNKNLPSLSMKTGAIPGGMTSGRGEEERNNRKTRPECE